MSCPLFLLIVFLFYLFTYFRLHSIFTIMHRLCLVVERRGYSLFVVHGLVIAVASHCGAWSWTRVPCFGRWIRNHWYTREVLPASYFLFTQICLSTSLSSFLSIPTSLSFDNFHDIVPQERKSTSVHIFISFSSMLCRLLSFNSHYPTTPSLSQNGNFSH